MTSSTIRSSKHYNCVTACFTSMQSCTRTLLRVRTYRHHETNDKPDDSQHHDDEGDDPDAPGVVDLVVQPVILLPTDAT